MIAKKLKTPRSTLKKDLDELLDMGFLKKIIAGNARVYELTNIGNEAMTELLAMTRSEKKGLQGFRVHNVRWSSVIERQPWKLNDALKENNFTVSNMNNWAQYTWNNKEEGVTIVFTPQKVHFFIEELWTDSPMDYYPIAQKKLLRIARGLEEKFSGLKLGSPERVFMIHKQHVANVGPLSQLADAYEMQTGHQVTYHGDRVHLDKSKGYYEEETVDKQQAPMDMENLVDFFNEWTKAPFWPKEVAILQASNEDLKQNLALDKKEITQKIADLGVSTTKQHNHIIDGMGMLSKQHEVLSRNDQVLSSGLQKLSDSQITMNEHIKGLSGVVGDVAESINVFGVAMHEHVALVKQLQQVSSDFKNAWGASVAEQNDFNAKMMALIDNNNTRLTKAVLELATPWYVKLGRSVRSLFKKKEDI
jgi:DNA-binding MarR family transcriptional regulator